MHTDGHLQNQTYPNILTFIRATPTVNNFEAWLKKIQNQRMHCFFHMCGVFWTERFHTGELFLKEKKIFSPKKLETLFQKY